MVYFSSKTELFSLIGDKISFLNKTLFNSASPLTPEIRNEVIETIEFLKDHKYQFMSQGLNQLEYIIRSAEQKVKEL